MNIYTIWNKALKDLREKCWKTKQTEQGKTTKNNVNFFSIICLVLKMKDLKTLQNWHVNWHSILHLDYPDSVYIYKLW